MVEFCPECSNLLRKKVSNGDKSLFCRCGFQKELMLSMEEINKDGRLKIKALDKNLIIVSHEDKFSVHPIVKKFCPKCNNKEAEAWQEQTRSADEPSTSFFRCLECRHTWREY
jgi:DNA-directed RNA polymerase subunit M